MSKCKITGKVLSIQLGREETQIVLMGKGSEVLHSALVETPAGAVEDGMIRNMDAVRGMLKEALKVPEFKRVRQAVFTLCTSQIITETVTVPDLPDSRLGKLLQSNVDMYFPVDMNDYQLVWQKIGSKNKGDLKEVAVQLWAVPNTMLPRYYAVGNACGLSVLAVDYCGHSIATAVGASFAKSAKAAKKPSVKLDLNAPITFGKKKEEKVEPAAALAVEAAEALDTDLHITLDKDLMGMTCVQEGQVVYQRFIRCGSDPSYQFGELAMMLEYFSAMEQGRGSYISGIVSGALADDRELVRELSDVLGINVKVLDSAVDPRFCLCVGAARTAMDFGNPALNKPGKARKDLQNSLWQYALILVGGLALISVIMLTLSSRIVWSSGIGRLESTRQNLMVQAQKTAGFADNYNAYVSKYNAYSADWDTVFSSLRTYNDNLVLVLEELENTLPENTSVTGLQINPDGMNVQFACATKEEAAYLIMALRELQYADLLNISDLQGGGVGPATSYGSDEEEQPPTEGSSQGGSALADLLDSEITEAEMDKMSANMTMDEVKALNRNYIAKASASHKSLDSLKANSSYDEKAFSNKKGEERADVVALRTLLTTNPYAAERFADMLINEDFDRGGDSYLMGHILLDLMMLQQSGKLDTESDLMGSMNALVDILVKDETTLLKTESLLKTDKEMETWYTYYLEVETGVQPARKLPYLDRDKLINDLMDGRFNSGSSGLDKKLGSAVTQGTRDTVQSRNSAEKLGISLNAYLSKGTAGNPVTDEMLQQYLKTGSSGCGPVDKNINGAVSGGAIDAQLTKMVETHKAAGTTGNADVDKLIEKYQEKGQTGSSVLDGLLDRSGVKYEEPTEPAPTDPPATEPPATEPKPTEPKPTEPKPTEPPVTEPPATEPKPTEPKPTEPGGSGGILGGMTEEDMKNMAIQYMLTGSTGNFMADVLLNNYKQNGTTGVPAVDAKLEPYKEYITGEVTMEDLIGQYISTGTTGNDQIDGMIGSYLTTGTTGNKSMDEVMDAYITSGALDSQIGEMMDKYLTTGTTGNKVFDKMVDNYLTKGTTGNKTLDKTIDGYLGKTSMRDKLLDMVINSVKNGTTGNKVVDSMVKNYLTTGSTGNKVIDSMIKDAITGNRPEPPAVDIPGIGDKPLGEVIGNLTINQLDQILENYLIYGSSGNDTLDEMLDDYFEKYTTGNDAFDKVIKDFIENGYASDELTNALLDYMNGANAGNSTLENMFKDYFDTGSTGNPTLDNIFDAFLGDRAPGKNPGGNKPGEDKPDDGFKIPTDAELKSMAMQYWLTGSTGNKFYDTLFAKYKKDGTTGFPELDKKLEPYKQYILASGNNGNTNPDHSDKLNGGAGGGGSADTRIFFSAMLGYNNQLISAELNRKGLDYSDKVQLIPYETEQQEVGE